LRTALEEYEAKSTLLAMREKLGQDTGENISAMVLPVVKEYGFVDKIGYFVGD
jgi:hypothetical protein